MRPLNSNSSCINKPIGELDLPVGCLVGAIARQGEGILIPDGSSLIHSGDRVVFFIQEGAVRELEARFLEGVIPA